MVSSIQSGLQGGRIDVILVRGIYKDLHADAEIISVEVKPKKTRFLFYLGQALGYSIFSDRCYLAIPQRFTKDEIDIANKLGIGLIEIKSKRCKEILSSSKFSPLLDTKLKLLQKLDIFRCTVCGSFLLDKSPSTNLKRALKNDKNFVYWLMNQGNLSIVQKFEKRNRIYYRRFMCSDCIKNFSQIG